MYKVGKSKKLLRNVLLCIIFLYSPKLGIIDTPNLIVGGHRTTKLMLTLWKIRRRCFSPDISWLEYQCPSRWALRKCKKVCNFQILISWLSQGSRQWTLIKTWILQHLVLRSREKRVGQCNSEALPRTFGALTSVPYYSLQNDWIIVS